MTVDHTHTDQGNRGLCDVCDARMPDRIDAAIGSASTGDTLWQVRIGSTGRTFAVGCADDATDGELLELIGWIGTTLMRSAREIRASKAHGGLTLVGADGRPKVTQ